MGSPVRCERQPVGPFVINADCIPPPLLVGDKSMELTSENVDTIIRDCLFTSAEVAGFGEGELPKDAIAVNGIVIKIALHSGRVEKHKDEILSMLYELPDVFFKNHGGGMSFLSMCNKANGEQWGEHPSMEALCILGIAAGFINKFLPREIWAMMPGGVPYVCINVDKPAAPMVGGSENG